MALELSTPVRFVRGVGPAYAQLLADKGILTLEDLLSYLPFRYEDRIHFRQVGTLRPGETACVLAEVATAGLVRFRGNRVRIFHLAARDVTGILYCRWFHGDYLQKVFRPGLRVVFYGKVEEDPYRPGHLLMTQPEFEILPTAGRTDSTEMGRIVPIYEATGRMSSRVFRRVIWSALESVDRGFPDPLPASIRARLGFPARRPALEQAHFPDASTDLKLLQAFRTPAQQRLIFEEFFYLEAGLALRRRHARAATGVVFEITDRVRERLKMILPFHPTAAQKRVLKEIGDDLSRPVPMNRLLQGDVGSGKTIVALEAAVIAIENGYQVALMAPTEILAVQHYLYARRIFARPGYRVDLLTSGVKSQEKQQRKEELARGEIQLLVGTHALLEENVAFARLGLVIIDEQHRFGVLQRRTLIEKAFPAAGQQPHVLVMTATPIPRTLALALYADLDLAVIDEMPPGRTPIDTRWVRDDRSAQVFDFLRQQVAGGRQAYIVYPVIEESKQELKAAIKQYQHLTREVFPDLKLDLLHGRMSSAEKDAAMERFRTGQTQVLVATPVVEVGVDVPNATVMVIEHADRFGLAQLHQLRGRIGRSGHKSYSVLMTGAEVSEVAAERLHTMVRTTNGFEIAEIDLRLRGPGEFFGTRQHGMVPLRVGNILRDYELLELAKREAFTFVESPSTQSEWDALLAHLRSTWHRHGLAEVA